MGIKMNTFIKQVNETQLDWGIIRYAGQIIRDGGLVAFPTETVYGLGGNALNSASASKIYEAKGRPSDNPLIIHISRLEDLQKITREVPEAAYRLAERFWPGPLTMIFHKADCVPCETTGGLSTVAVRMPSNKVALAFIQEAGGFVAAPSANLSGRPSPTIAKYVIEDLCGRIEMILDGGTVDIGLESTILDMTESVPMILRPGYITREMLTKVIPEVIMDEALMDIQGDKQPKAPGMKYRHYAPKGELTIIEGNETQVIEYINNHVKKSQESGKKTGVISTDGTHSFYQADSVKSVGNRKEETSIARHLYQVLREFDEEQVSVIYTESFQTIEMGQAVMNRLLKAAGHHIIELTSSDSTVDVER